MLSDSQLMHRIEDYKFDLAIIDGPSSARFMHIIAHRFKIPYITYTDSLDDLAFGGFPNLDEGMNFMERLNYIVSRYFLHFQEPVHKNLLYEYRQSDDVNHWEDLVALSELFIVQNSYFLYHPSPIWPNVLNVHSVTAQPPKMLPVELNNLLKAHQGNYIVIVNFYTRPFTFYQIKNLLKIFGNMDCLFLWKYQLGFDERKTLHIPDNVQFWARLPINDILGDDRVNMLITDGYTSSKMEGIFHGKPFISIEVFPSITRFQV